MGRKEFRQNKIIEKILENGKIPKDLSKLANSLDVSVRTVQRDINNIRETLPQYCLNDMKEQTLIQLQQRIPDLKDGNLIRLLEFFVSKKRDVQVRTEGELHIKIWPWSEKNVKN